jgi:hypothetical protein
MGKGQQPVQLPSQSFNGHSEHVSKYIASIISRPPSCKYVGGKQTSYEKEFGYSNTPFGEEFGRVFPNNHTQYLLVPSTIWPPL